MGEATLGFSSPAICSITGLPPSTLSYWVKTGLVEPSLLPSSGRRATRWWSLEDLVTIRAIKALREAGCPMPTLRRAREVIEDAWGQSLPSSHLCWTGDDVLVVEQWGTIRSAVKRPGQLVFHLMAIPLQEWLEEARPLQVEVDLDRLRANAVVRQGRPATPIAPSTLGSTGT